MFVADTSALISIATGKLLEQFLNEFDVHTTETVYGELETTAEYDDAHGRAAERVIDADSQFTLHSVDDRRVTQFESSQIDEGEASCVGVEQDLSPEFFVTDDLRAVPELRRITTSDVAISPVVLRALTERGVLSKSDARQRLDSIAATRDWLGAPIYNRARKLLDD
jgi:predicted nucleic acid-binding protein